MGGTRMPLSVCPRCGLDYEPIIPGEHNGIHGPKMLTRAEADAFREYMIGLDKQAAEILGVPYEPQP